MAKKSFNIVVLPGDGIGPEVIQQAVRVLNTISEASPDIQLKLAFHEIGGAAIDATGQNLPDSTLKACKDADAILMGAVGGPKWATSPVRPEVGLLTLRKSLDLYANIRPASFVSKSLVECSPLKPEIAAGTNLIVVRELVGGLYFGERKEQGVEPKLDTAWDTMIYSVEEVKRITRVAAKIALAANPPHKIVSIDKANVLASSRLWRKVVTETLSEEFPQLKLEHQLVDSAAMIIVANPKKLNGVLLTENMFGDILSDETSVLVGSLGLLPSASLAGAPKTDLAPGEKPPAGLYEPIHGSAPDIAGQGIANPIGTILSAAMLLRYSLGLEKQAQAIEAAVASLSFPSHPTISVLPCLPRLSSWCDPASPPRRVRVFTMVAILLAFLLAVFVLPCILMPEHLWRAFNAGDDASDFYFSDINLVALNQLGRSKETKSSRSPAACPFHLAHKYHAAPATSGFRLDEARQADALTLVSAFLACDAFYIPLRHLSPLAMSM
ncbi:LEU2 [Sanghuangporus vaninii]